MLPAPPAAYPSLARGPGPLTVQYPFPIEYHADRTALVRSLVSPQPLGVERLPGQVYNVPVRRAAAAAVLSSMYLTENREKEGGEGVFLQGWKKATVGGGGGGGDLLRWEHCRFYRRRTTAPQRHCEGREGTTGEEGMEGMWGSHGRWDVSAVHCGHWDACRQDRVGMACMVCTEAAVAAATAAAAASARMSLPPACGSKSSTGGLCDAHVCDVQGSSTSVVGSLCVSACVCVWGEGSGGF